MVEEDACSCKCPWLSCLSMGINSDSSSPSLLGITSCRCSSESEMLADSRTRFGDCMSTGESGTERFDETDETDVRCNFAGFDVSKDFNISLGDLEDLKLFEGNA